LLKNAVKGTVREKATDLLNNTLSRDKTEDGDTDEGEPAKEEDKPLNRLRRRLPGQN
jgi:hypothetical protein